MARVYMDNGRDKDAADVLAPLANDPDGGELAEIGALRLGRILIYQGKAEEAIALVKDRPESAFAARYDELLGDAYYAAGRYAEAEAAYVAALNDNPLAPTVDPQLIQLKINDLPVPGEDVAEPPTAAPEDAEAAGAETAEAVVPPEPASPEDGDPDAQ